MLWRDSVAEEYFSVYLSAYQFSWMPTVCAVEGWICYKLNLSTTSIFCFYKNLPFFFSFIQNQVILSSRGLLQEGCIVRQTVRAVTHSSLQVPLLKQWTTGNLYFMSFQEKFGEYPVRLGDVFSMSLLTQRFFLDFRFFFQIFFNCSSTC